MERPGRERWGPGGEVVQELKDVIWKVGEKKRKMSQQVQAPLVQQLEQESERERGVREMRQTGEGPETEEVKTALHPISVPERETSITIEVIDDASAAEGEDLACEPESEATEFETESELAYLDSPSPSHPQRLADPLAGSCLVLESDSGTDDTQRTASHSVAAHAPSPLPTTAVLLEADGALDVS